MAHPTQTTSTSTPPPPDPSADGTGLIAQDPYLEPYAEVLRARYEHLQQLKRQLNGEASALGPITLGHEFFGFNRGEHHGQPGLWYREWAPGADYLALIGEFNDWDRGSTPLERGEFGVWSVFLPDEQYADRLTHGSTVKVHVANDGGYAQDRIPAYIRRVVQAPDGPEFFGQLWMPPPSNEHVWQHDQPTTLPSRDDGDDDQARADAEGVHADHPLGSGEGLRVYEAHVGMAQEQGKVGTFDEFRRNVLPRIAELGYNALQLMAVQEHPYYGSFGYHVSNLFAPSSRFGTPSDLKRLIDEAHGLGLRVIMDIVHSHMVKNTAEGLNRFDGTDHQYFHAGPRGVHPGWDSMCFDYAKHEVLRLLLSNVRYWAEEFRFDGFRFDGVTSMLYIDHGTGGAFDHYDRYFGANSDGDAIAYLALANEVAHSVRPNTVTIAEEVSGMPGLARPTDEGGLGFDYRLAMGVPDFWIKQLKHKADEDWDLFEMYQTLLNRRWHEKHIGYAESHDQALVGDKTLAMWLMDAAMYESMSADSQSVVVDRGIALHKLIRLVTFTLAGEGWLNFIGNEFGHPEWVDFPRAGNNHSYHYARRQWSLVDNQQLRYRHLNAFDKLMQALDAEYHILADKLIEQLAVHNDTRQLVYRRGPVVFALNFHPTQSYADLRIPVPDPADYRLVLNSDATAVGGQNRIDPETTYPLQPDPMYGRDQSIQIYLPAYTAVALVPK